MQFSEQGMALLKEFEGFSAQEYVCPAGKRTIGYGHVIGADEVFEQGGISYDEAEKLLKGDVSVAERAVARFEGGISQGQWDALVCFAFNIGAHAFENSTLYRFLLAGDTAGAAGQFDRWVYAGGEKNMGLIRRRQAEKMLFLS